MSVESNEPNSGVPDRQERPADPHAVTPQPELRPGYSTDGSSGGGIPRPIPPRLDEKNNVEPVPKRNRWLLPVVLACLVGIGLATLGTHQQPPSRGSLPPSIGLIHHQDVLTVTGADVDQAATERAKAELKSGAPDALLKALPESVKEQLLSGERKMYRIPPLALAGAAPAQEGDAISVDFNSIPYGTYDLGKPVTLDMPLQIGDQVGVHCVSLAPGKSSVAVDLATVMNPAHIASLRRGESQSLKVVSGDGGKNYDWFKREAQGGNAVAQYGLGHMYQYGLGVEQDKSAALHWYGLAAEQNYLDAKAQLQLLHSSP